MEKISLLGAGKFLLGIDAAAIVRKVTVNSFTAEEQKQGSVLIHLASFLSQQPLALSKAKGEGIVVVTDCESLLLVIDRTLGEIDVPDRFEPLPRLYPDLARHCCPQIFVHNNQVVLLLDVRELGSVCAKLETGCGLIPLDELHGTEDTLAAGTSGKSSSKSKSEQPVTKIDDETFAGIVSWVIDKYLERNSEEQVVINASELTLEQKQLWGFRDEELQAMINKIIRRFDKLHDDTLHRLRKRLVV